MSRMVDQVSRTQTDLQRAPDDLPEPKLTKNARTVLERRYLQHDDAGNPLETPGGAFWRVAREVARGSVLWETPESVDRVARDYYMMMARLDFLPNSPTLMNAGKGNGLQYSACYVLPVPDSMEEIFDSVKAAAIIHKCLVGDTLVMSDGLRRLDAVGPGARVMTDEGPFYVSEPHD